MTPTSAKRGRRGPTTRGFGARLLGALTLLAVIDGEVVGFASLKDGEEIDMLFVDPEFARQGVGRALIEALTKLAQARGAKRLTTEASDVAKPLFERAGLRGPEAQPRAQGRPMARRHHHDQDRLALNRAPPTRH